MSLGEGMYYPTHSYRPDAHSQRYERRVSCLIYQYRPDAHSQRNNIILCLTYMYLYDIIYMDLCVYVLLYLYTSAVM